MVYLEFIFIDFWHFLGILILLSTVLKFFSFLWNRFWRHLSIRRHGYPPAHCDADGDFFKKEETNYQI